LQLSMRHTTYPDCGPRSLLHTPLSGRKTPNRRVAECRDPSNAAFEIRSSASIFNFVFVNIHNPIELRVLFEDTDLVQVALGLQDLQHFVSCVESVENCQRQYRVGGCQWFGMRTNLLQGYLVRFLQINPTLESTKSANDFEVVYDQSIDIHLYKSTLSNIFLSGFKRFMD
jgi:hypothetical protein